MIINLTQHVATTEQIAGGVVDLPAELRAKLGQLLTFDTLPPRSVVCRRAHQIAELASSWLDNQPHPADYGQDGSALAEAMIDGEPCLMAQLEIALLECAIAPVYAFSIRESTEQHQPDGSVRKVAVFRHDGFVRIFEDEEQ